MVIECVELCFNSYVICGNDMRQEISGLQLFVDAGEVLMVNAKLELQDKILKRGVDKSLKHNIVF